VRAVMDAVGSRRAVLLGESEGGPLSMLFAAAHPERVAALVLCGAEVTERAGQDWPWGESAEGNLRPAVCWHEGATTCTHCSRAAVIRLVRLWFSPPGLVKAVYRVQGEPEVADLGEHAVQRGLVGERAGHGRLLAVVLDPEVPEPGRPVGVEDPLDPDLVASGCSWAGHARVLLRARQSVTSPSRGAVIAVPPVVAVSGTSTI
jgi:pimeloyl-ACP methyl ester carboxylesterase